MILREGTKRPEGKGHAWRYGYALFCLAYAAWVVYLGLDNFHKVHGEYSRAREHQQPAQVERIALQELIAECRREAGRSGRSRTADDTAATGSEDACRSFPADVLRDRTKVVAENLRADERLFLRKLVTFFITFAIFFVALPLGFLYLLLAFLIWLFRDLKLVKDPKK